MRLSTVFIRGNCEKETKQGKMLRPQAFGLVGCRPLPQSRKLWNFSSKTLMIRTTALGRKHSKRFKACRQVSLTSLTYASPRRTSCQMTWRIQVFCFEKATYQLMSLTVYRGNPQYEYHFQFPINKTITKESKRTKTKTFVFVWWLWKEPFSTTPQRAV